MSEVWRNRGIGIALAAAIYALDQWVKRMVAGAWGLIAEGYQVEVLPFFNLTRSHNRGVSLGMFPADSVEMRWLLVAVTALIALVVLVWLLRERKLPDIAGLALILGGALGNIHDRYSFGYVLDYADLHFGTFRPFLIFNVADACITIGVLIILARALFMREKPPQPHDGQVADQPAENSPHA